MLSMVDMPLHARILELGTDPDFGYTALLLARASRRGNVISVSESERATDQVRRAHQSRTRHVPSFHTGPLANGWPSDAPYELVISHSLFGWLPQSWLAQCAPGATIVMPLEHASPEPRLYLRVQVNDWHVPTGALLLVELDAHPHHTSYGTTDLVDLEPDTDGYTITANITAIDTHDS